ncbi:hypothetical protein PRIPAC_76627 [Pristionchus pacificus]|uniref:Uncharacterized protein n=1 Tax=Pristionchus pacificus TaxID=54126 RepID=A0A2A6C1X6_PRIPA|nr:hypothetical protein PRIPAC_76627 [Pristionchus pacificus]|eukprot:PDM72023.1 hypothetical protein PRIPAC_38430 [Pristionchus pacificus]
MVANVCKALKYWVEISALNLVKDPIFRYFYMSKEGEFVTTEIFIPEMYINCRLESRTYLICALGHLNIDGFVFTKSNKASITTTSKVTEMILDNLSSIMSKVRCAALEFEPSTEEMFSLASKFILGRQLRCVTLHLSDSESSRNFALQVVRQLGTPAVCLNLTAGIFDYDAFLINLAEIVGLMSITAPIDKYEAFEDWPRLQRLAFNVLSSRCYYFDIAHAFVKIPMTEGNSLSTVLSRIQDKPFYFGAPTAEKCRRSFHSNNIPVRVEMMNFKDGPLIEIGMKGRSRN